MGTLRTEFRSGRKLATAVRANPGQRVCAVFAELRPGSILMLAPRTLHAEPPVNRAGRQSGTKVARRGGGVNFALFEHLIRPQQQRRRDGEAESLGGLEVDRQLELHRLRDGQVEE